MKSQKTLFLEKVFLGRETDFSNQENVIYRCVKLAYRDMLAAGRYYLSNDADARCRDFICLLEHYNYNFSRQLIDDSLTLFGDNEIIGDGNKYVTRFGLSQKFVNMSFKNFYVCSDYINKNINFSLCDCPLDSIILGKLPQTGTVWSKLTKGTYELCQNRIASILASFTLNDELLELGNMAFDFLNW